MKAIFVHDHPFYMDKPNEKFFSGGGLPSTAWKRYLTVFDQLVVVGRGHVVSDTRGLSLSSHENVTFKPCFGVAGGVDYLLKKKKIKNHLRPLIKQADAVVLRLPSFFGSCAVEICNELDKPYLAEMVGCTWDSNWNYGNLIGKLRAPFSLLQTKKAIKNASAVIYVTEHFLQKRYPTNAKVTSFASNVFIHDFPSSVLSEHQALLQKNRDCYRLALLANLQVKYKGFDVAFKAVAAAKNKLDKPIELLLFGGGDSSYVQPLIDRYGIQDDVKIMGLLSSGQEVYKALDDLDLYIQPSLTEGLPRAVIEAMSRGCPVLASSAGGIPELLDDKYLHKPGDYKALAKHLVKYLPNQNALLQMSEKNFYRSKEYTLDVLEKRRNAFWVEVRDLLE